MSAAAYNFRVVKGDSRVLRVRLKTRDVFTGKVGVVDMTDRIVKWTIGSTTKTTAGGGGLVVDPETAIISYALTPTETAALAASTPYRIILTDLASSFVSTRLAGRIIAEEVSQ